MSREMICGLPWFCFPTEGLGGGGKGGRKIKSKEDSKYWARALIPVPGNHLEWLPKQGTSIAPCQ